MGTGLWRVIALGIAACVASPWTRCASAGAPEPTRATSTYNLTKAHVAAGGYDVVAYFPEGGGKPRKGDAQFEHTDRGVVYRFASSENLERFTQRPDAYIPAHGGWCSWAMADDGSKVEVDPRSFLVSDGRLFLFYKDLITDTRAKFEKDVAGNSAKADANWKRISGEAPIVASAEGPAVEPDALSRELDALRARFEASAPEDLRLVLEDGMRQVAESGVVERALKVGATAPDFTLTDASGGQVRLADLLAQGPVVLTWYRGGWCPYCNAQLQAYQRALGEIRSAGGVLVAISPELPVNAVSTKEKNALEFVVLSDVGGDVARRFGVSYRLPDSLIEVFKGRLDLPEANGDESWELPLGATYVIARDGTIAYAFVSADYRERAEPSAIIGALRALR